MKMRNNSAVLVLSSVICLLPIILSFVVYDELPEQIAIHWSSSGNPDNFAPKAVAAFGLPFFFTAINLFSKIHLYYDPKRSDSSKTMQIITEWIVPFLSLILVPMTLFIAMGAKIPISVFASVFTGVLLILCGNYLPKSRQNYTIGIKLPWTLHDADNRNKTHRMAGYLYIFGGIILIIEAFISSDISISGISAAVPVVVSLIVIPVLYSWLLYRKNDDTLNGN